MRSSDISDLLYCRLARFLLTISLRQARWQIECRSESGCLCTSRPSRMPKRGLATTSAAGIQRRLLGMPMTVRHEGAERRPRCNAAILAQLCCTRDGGRSSEPGLQDQGANHRKLLRPNDRGGERVG